MKTIHIFSILPVMFSLLFSGCSTSPISIDDKYTFTNFEEVDSITNYKISGWQAIDEQSLIVSNEPSTHYLVILRNKVYRLNFSEAISITSTNTRIEVGFDCVQVEISSCGGISGAPIARIYKLNNNEDVIYVKNRIRGT